MMFRPRESHDLRLLEARRYHSPTHSSALAPRCLRQLHCHRDLRRLDSELRFDSVVTLEHVEITLPDYPLEEYAHTYPFRYSDDELPNLARALAHHYPSDDVARWVRQFLDRPGALKP